LEQVIPDLGPTGCIGVYEAKRKAEEKAHMKDRQAVSDREVPGGSRLYVIRPSVQCILRTYCVLGTGTQR
jgi:hypothetical protein